MILSRLAIVIASATAVVTACGAGDDPNQAAVSPIVATTSIWADIASATACGIDVPSVIPVGADAHTFEPSLRDRERLENASIVIANGGGLEGRLTDLLTTVASGDANVVEITPWIDTIAVESDDHDDDDHDGDDESAGEHDNDPHGHGLDIDPHVWHDPRRVAGALEVIASAASAIEIDTCAESYRAELEVLDRDIVALLEIVPEPDRVLVTSHDSLQYFADRYGFEIVGTVIPATNTLAETNAADLAELAERIEERGVRAVFTDAFASTSDADALADRLGVDVVPLVTDALTDDPATDTYIEMMRSNAEAIASALAP